MAEDHTQPHEPSPEPAPPLQGRIVGWYRPDVSSKIWLFLPGCMLLTAIGALFVGYGYGRLERADPVGIHADARAYEARQARDDAAKVSLWPKERGRGESFGAMWGFFAIGLLLVASGPACAIAYLRRLWSQDDFLLLRTDGLVTSLNGASATIPWDTIAAIRLDEATGTVELEMRAGERQTLEPRLVDDAPGLAKRLEEVRRKAIWNLLPEQR